MFSVYHIVVNTEINTTPFLLHQFSAPHLNPSVAFQAPMLSPPHLHVHHSTTLFRSRCQCHDVLLNNKAYNQHLAKLYMQKHRLAFVCLRDFVNIIIVQYR